MNVMSLKYRLRHVTSNTCGVLWGQQSLRVTAYHKGPLKCQFFALKSYCTSTCSWFMRKIISDADHLHFLYQQLFSVSYSYFTKDEYFSPGEWLSIGTGCWERMLTLHLWRYLTLNWAWHSADERLKLDCCDRSWTKQKTFIAQITKNAVFWIYLQFLLIFYFFFSRSHGQIQSEGNTISISHCCCVSNISFSLILSTKLMFLLVFFPEVTI